MERGVKFTLAVLCAGGTVPQRGVSSRSVVADSATPWAAARQAPLSTRFSRQGYWSGLPFPSPGDFPSQGSNPSLLHCRQILYQLSYKGSPVSITDQRSIRKKKAKTQPSDLGLSLHPSSSLQLFTNAPTHRLDFIN